MQFCACEWAGRGAAGQVSAPILLSETGEGAEARLPYVCFGDFAKLKRNRVSFTYYTDLTIGINGQQN